MRSTQEAVAAHLSAENEQRHVRDNLLQTSVRETVSVAIALVDARGVVRLYYLVFCPDVSRTKRTQKVPAVQIIRERRAVATR